MRPVAKCWLLDRSGELAKAVQGVAENELALPFTRPVAIPAHGLMRKRATWMLLLYRWRDAREIA